MEKDVYCTALLNRYSSLESTEQNLFINEHHRTGRCHCYTPPYILPHPQSILFLGGGSIRALASYLVQVVHANCRLHEVDRQDVVALETCDMLSPSPAHAAQGMDTCHWGHCMQRVKGVDAGVGETEVDELCRNASIACPTQSC